MVKLVNRFQIFVYHDVLQMQSVNQHIEEQLMELTIHYVHVQPSPFGPTCHLNYDQCSPQPCANNGTCFDRQDRIGQNSYECQCTEAFYGDHCQNEKRLMEIALLNSTYSPLKHIVQYYDINWPTYTLIRRIQQVYSSTPISFRFYNEKVNILSVALLKICEKHDREPLYFLLSVQQNTTSTNKTSSLENHCPLTKSFPMIKDGKHRQI
jgi:hypothetical protein